MWNEIRFLLGLQVKFASTMALPDGWDAFCVGARRRGATSVWICYRKEAKSILAPNLLPVIEGVSGRRAGGDPVGKLSCCYCARAATNRGKCDHEEGGALRIYVSTPDDIGDNEGISHKFNKYLSTLPRRALPCKSDFWATFRMLVSLSKVCQTRCQTGKVNEEGEATGDLAAFAQNYVAMDRRRPCKGTGCNTMLYGAGPHKNIALNHRGIKLHTLVYGSTVVTIADLICNKCHTYHFFDGRDEGMFVLSFSTAFCRELIELWIYCVAGQGRTFRGAYELSRKVASSPSARFCHLVARGGMLTGLCRRF